MGLIRAYSETEDSWYVSYALETLRLKGIETKDGNVLENEVRAIEKAFKTVYRAVAFDVDGTLTIKGETRVAPIMAAIIRSLLARSVPVVLITGRGRGSAREAALEITKMPFYSKWYDKRLYCITHNGVFLLSTQYEEGAPLLEHEEKLTSFIDKYDVTKNVEEVLSGLDVEISKEPQSLRIILNNDEVLKEKVEKILRQVIIDVKSKGRQNLFLTSGGWGTKQCYDICPTNKQKALSHFANSIGVPEEQILRIGDQGHKLGNDFGMLCSPVGFCVGTLSPQPEVCHPVLSGEPPIKLENGAAATKHLLSSLLIFSPLSISPGNPNKQLDEIRIFEGLALARARKETVVFQNRLRLRMKHIIDDEDDIFDYSAIDLSDIYDLHSGAIRFRDWEITHINPDCPFAKLFQIHELLNHDINSPPMGDKAMFTDTGIMLRGPFYYYALVNDKSDDLIHNYMEEAIAFIRQAQKSISDLYEREPSLITYKFLLGLLDNLRNFLLQIFYISFMSIEGSKEEKPCDLSIEILTKALKPHTYFYYTMLLDPDADWKNHIKLYTDILKDILSVAELFNKSNMSGSIKVSVEDKCTLRNWRENDNIIENIIAVQLGLHQLYKLEEVREYEKLYLAGIMYGGTELPIIGEIVSKARGFTVEPIFLKISLYGEKEFGDKIRAGDQYYVSEMLRHKKPFLIPSDIEKSSFSQEGIIMLDDNCTTCSTLQFARDFLLSIGADVLGAVTVRFPGVNRSMQMGLPGHGMPYPEVLFGFIRGLVSRSPYARLLSPTDEEDGYLDCTGIFDKSRSRIERYLRKNGTPHQV